MNPKRCFKNQEELSSFVHIITRHIESPKLKLEGYQAGEKLFGQELSDISDEDIESENGDCNQETAQCLQFKCTQDISRKIVYINYLQTRIGKIDII